MQSSRSASEMLGGIMPGKYTHAIYQIVLASLNKFPTFVL